MARYFIVIILVLSAIPAKTQVILQTVLDSIAENNLHIRASLLDSEAQTMKAKTGISPSDPEVIYGHFPGTTAGTGTKTTLNVTQSFDFPLVYARKKQGSSLAEKQNNEVFRNEKRHVLYTAASSFIEFVYLGQLISEYSRRADEAASALELTLKSMQAGNANQIELNKAQIEALHWKNELNMLNVKKQQHERNLATLNNGKPIDLAGAVYPYWHLPSPDSIYQTALLNDPVVKALEYEVMLADNNRKLQQSLWMPKMSAGYGQEITPGESYKGIQAGISVPLWQNKNTVKYARLQEESVRGKAEVYKQRLSDEIINRHQSVKALQDNLGTYGRALETIKTADLLKKSLDTGNISILEYYRELLPWYEMIDEYLRTSRDYYSEMLGLMLFYW